MSSKDRILSKIKAAKPERLLLPELDTGRFHTQNDRIQQFKTVTEQVGGRLIPEDVKDIHAFLTEQFPDLKMRYSALKGSEEFNTVDPEKIEKPHELEKLDLLVLEGVLGVAENAGIWLQDAQLPVRVLPFITKQLIIKIDPEKVVSNLHEAYARLTGTDFDYGLLLSGPSKTADIEQVLVVGAQGALGVSVWLA